MKTETQIAKENVEKIEKIKESIRHSNSRVADALEVRIWKLKAEVQGHKQTCQRWLEFLEEECNTEYSNIRTKYVDLKEAIKIYTEAGI